MTTKVAEEDRIPYDPDKFVSDVPEDRQDLQKKLVKKVKNRFEEYGSAINGLIDSEHDRLHDIDSPNDHNGVSGATENNFMAFDANGLPKDSEHKDADYADATHASQHKNEGADEILLNELGEPTSSVTMNSQKITNLADPLADGDGANKGYVDDYAMHYDGTKVYDANAPTSFTDLDLSAVIGSKRSMVYLKIKNNGASAYKQYLFRTNGQTEDVSYITGYVSFGGVCAVSIDQSHIGCVIVITDASGVIEWMAVVANSTQIWVEAYQALQ